MLSSLILMAPPADANGAGGFDFSFLIMMAVVFAIMYFLMIRPQQKRQKEQQEMINSLKRDDKVITSTGIHGKIISNDETSFLVQIAENVNVRFEKAAISSKKEK